MPSSRTSLARQVRAYLETHPPVGDALASGLANHSAVARHIARELKLNSFGAILAACRRYPVRPDPDHREDGIRRVLHRSRVEVRTRVAAITVRPGVDVLQSVGPLVEQLLRENALCRVIQVSQGTVIVVSEDAIPRFTRKLRDAQVVRIRRALAEVAVTSPESIEGTPGLLSRLAALLSAQGINIVEAMSCYTDTIFVLHRDDLTAAMGVLSQAVD
ncbi:MAG: hypothetical protein WCA77_01165 [Thermoplasmata archaeon]